MPLVVLGYSPGTMQNELKGSDRGIFTFFWPIMRQKGELMDNTDHQ
jgi:hypothetical protein